MRSEPSDIRVANSGTRNADDSSHVMTKYASKSDGHCLVSPHGNNVKLSLSPNKRTTTS